ncbi:MAG: hypothetical protein IJW45_01775 [Oscillospiraceae bacterium]|nr:hypothetical protein [Oscillospiraceae bacterium]
MTNKVYLRSSTPFSLKDRYTSQMVLRMGGMALCLAAVTVMFYVMGNELAGRFTIITIAWTILSGILTGMILGSYAAVEDGALVYAPLTIGKKRIERQRIGKVALTQGRIGIYVDGALTVSLPDNQAARELVQRLGHPVERC